MSDPKPEPRIGDRIRFRSGVRVASDEQIERLVNGIDAEHWAHPERIVAPVVTLVARIEQDKATIAAQDDEILRLKESLKELAAQATIAWCASVPCGSNGPKRVQVAHAPLRLPSTNSKPH